MSLSVSQSRQARITVNPLDLEVENKINQNTKKFRRYIKNFDADELLKDQPAERDSERDIISKKINNFIQQSGWKNQPGEYFNVIVDEKRPSNGTYINFRIRFPESNAPGVGVNPSLGHIISAARTTAAIENLIPQAVPSVRSVILNAKNSLFKYVFPRYRGGKPPEEFGTINYAIDSKSENSEGSNTNTSYNFERVNKLRSMINYTEEQADAVAALLDGIV